MLQGLLGQEGFTAGRLHDATLMTRMSRVGILDRLAHNAHRRERERPSWRRSSDAAEDIDEGARA